MRRNAGGSAEQAKFVEGNSNGFKNTDAAIEQGDCSTDVNASSRAAVWGQRVSAPSLGRLSGVNHELRTPLTSIIGFSDVLREEVFGPLGNERYGDYAAHIHESGQQLLRAIDGVIGLIELQNDRPRADEVSPDQLELPEFGSLCGAVGR